jgi:hypothetical protein
VKTILSLVAFLVISSVSFADSICETQTSVRLRTNGRVRYVDNNVGVVNSYNQNLGVGSDHCVDEVVEVRRFAVRNNNLGVNQYSQNFGVRQEVVYVDQRTGFGRQQRFGNGRVGAGNGGVDQRGLINVNGGILGAVLGFGSGNRQNTSQRGLLNLN